MTRSSVPGWWGLIAVLGALSGCGRPGDRAADAGQAPSAAAPSAESAPARMQSPFPSASTPAAASAPPLIGPMPIAPPGKLPRRPRVALYEKNPWARELGSEAPTLVVYDDGSAIRQRPPEAGSPARLVEGRFGDAPAALAALESDLSPVNEWTSVSASTDQPSTSILLETKAGWIRRGVYGMVGGCRPVDQADRPPPAGFLRACHALLDRPLEGERPYAPEAPAGSNGQKRPAGPRIVVPAGDYLDRVNHETWRVWAETINARARARAAGP